MSFDQADPLAHARERFSLPESTVYLDGNSLGAMPTATAFAVGKTITQEWGRDLIGSWNSADWVNLPTRVAAKLAPLLGAHATEVLIADSTSINIFKLLAGVLMLPEIVANAKRRVIISERENFPTDLYIAEGINALLGNRYQLRLVAKSELVNAIDDTTAAALITHIDYRTGQMHDMAHLNRIAHAAGTNIVWDLSHSAGAVALTLNEDHARFAIGCGYKYLNGGPGAPGYLYVAREFQPRLSTPLSGWFGHEAPFTFGPTYTPADNITKFSCGTPSVLAIVALGVGLDTFEHFKMADIRKKSLALSDLFLTLMDTHCDAFGVSCVSPREHATRGSQLSFSHPNAYALMRAIIDRGVVGDFRQPNLIRFGFTPLYTRYVDCWDAVMALRDVLATNRWRDEKYQQRLTVT